MLFTIAIIERCRGRDASVGEAMIETCFSGVSTYRIEGVSRFCGGFGVSAATDPDSNKKAFASFEGWRHRPREFSRPFACVDGVFLKRSWGGSYENVAVMVLTAPTSTAT